MSNDNDKPEDSPRDLFIRRVREAKYTREFMNKIAERATKPVKWTSDEQAAIQWEYMKNFAWGTGAMAGAATLFATRHGIKLASRLVGFKPSFQHYTVPSVCMAATVGTGAACWNRNDGLALVKCAEKLPLISGHSPAMNQFCPSLRLTIHEALEKHPDKELLDKPQQSVRGNMLTQAYNSCTRRLLHQVVIAKESGMKRGEGQPPPIPKSGVAEWEEIVSRIQKLEEAGSWNDGPADDDDKSQEPGSASEDSTVVDTAIPSGLSEKDVATRKKLEFNLAMDVVEAIELDTSNVGVLGLQPEEDRALEWDEFKDRVGGLAFMKGAMYGTGAFVALRLARPISGRLFSMMRSQSTFDKWELPSRAGFATGLGTFVACWNEEAEGTSPLPELALRPGRSPAADEYCPIVVEHMERTIETHPHGALLLGPQTDEGKLLARVRETCSRRMLCEDVLRREQGLGDKEPVSIPEPGVPEMDVLKAMWKTLGGELDVNGTENETQVMHADSVRSLVTDQEDQAIE